MNVQKQTILTNLFQACKTCGEKFEKSWDDDVEGWRLKDAIRCNGRTYHPVCCDDANVSDDFLL